jgi:hypothetical protein
MESQFIEVMKIKMHMIQFVLVVNLIRMKLMGMIHSETPISSEKRAPQERNANEHVRTAPRGPFPIFADPAVLRECIDVMGDAECTWWTDYFERQVVGTGIAILFRIRIQRRAEKTNHLQWSCCATKRFRQPFENA